MNNFIFTIFLLWTFFDISSSIECYGGDVEIGSLTEKFVDYNCPSLMDCFIVVQEQMVAGENGSMMVMKKGCVEKAGEDEYEGSPSCFNFDFSNTSAEFLTHGFKCTCNKSFCNGIIFNTNTSSAINFSIFVFFLIALLS